MFLLSFTANNEIKRKSDNENQIEEEIDDEPNPKYEAWIKRGEKSGKDENFLIVEVKFSIGITRRYFHQREMSRPNNSPAISGK